MLPATKPPQFAGGAGELQTRALTGRTGCVLADLPPAQPGGTESADAEDTANADITPPAPAT